MSTNTKAKINLAEGIIELEGSEAFVTKHLEVFTQQMKQTKFIKSPEHKEPKNNGDKEEPNSSNPKPEKPTRRRNVRTPQRVAPIPLELKAADGKPALKEFFKEKQPKTHMENLTVFAYYLKNYLKIEDMLAGHVISCCNEVGQRAPTSIPSMFQNIQHLKGWLDVGVGAESAQITNLGEDFVKFDLPRKDDATKDKAAA